MSNRWGTVRGGSNIHPMRYRQWECTWWRRWHAGPVGDTLTKLNLLLLILILLLELLLLKLLLLLIVQCLLLQCYLSIGFKHSNGTVRILRVEMDIKHTSLPLVPMVDI